VPQVERLQIQYNNTEKRCWKIRTTQNGHYVGVMTEVKVKALIQGKGLRVAVKSNVDL
jgi:hypothetical protein